MQSKKKILIIVHIVLRFESCRSSPDRRVLSVQIQNTKIFSSQLHFCQIKLWFD